MKFSVIIPLYNKEKYIINTLKSAINQTFNDFEIIIINDSSTDNSLELVQNIKNDKIKIYSIKNSGVSFARNFGIGIAEGDYIAFLDSDDLWLPNHLETINQMIHSYPHCGLYFTAYNMLFPNGTYKSCYKIPNCKETIVFDNYCNMVMLSGGYTPCWTSVIVIKKNIFKNGLLFPVGIKAGEDLDLWLRIGLRYPSCYCPTITATYLQATENNSQYGQNTTNVFKYEQWYRYDTNNNQLKNYTTNMLIARAKYLNRDGYFHESIKELIKCKGRHKILKRIYYMILSTIHLKIH